MSRADVAARTVADQLHLAAGPVDVNAVVSRLGLIVIRQDTDAAVDGMLIRRDGQDAIGLNAAQTPERQRFTLAHLIGHQQIHARRDLILDGPVRHTHGRLSSIPTDREEADANRFAAALLIPEAAVRKLAAETDFATSRDLTERLAAHFEVSFAVMTYRLMTLGIVMDL